MKILITGSRDWIEEQAMRDALLPYCFAGHHWCHGAARGADAMAAKILHEFGEVVRGYPVRHSLDGPWPAAGHRRNERMFNDFKPDLVIAFPLPQSRGTVGMMDYAEKKGCTVHKVRL